MKSFYFDNLTEDELNDLVDEDYFINVMKLPTNHSLKNLKTSKKQLKIRDKKLEN